MNRTKKISLILILALALVSLAGPALADRGVFNAQVTPNEMLTADSPVTVKVTAEIGSGNQYISSVKVYSTTATGQPLALLTQMYDDGTHGDERPRTPSLPGNFRSARRAGHNFMSWFRQPTRESETAT